MIIVTDKDGKEYQLEYNRKVINSMEDNGFVLDLDKPYSTVDRLFRGAFRMHHPRIDPDKVREIWAAQVGKEKLIAALVKLYQKPIDDLMAEPEGADEGNPTWKET